MFVQIIPKIYIAMMKNNSNELGSYVSPAVKVVQINPRRVMCQSPMDLNSINPWIEDNEDDLGC